MFRKLVKTSGTDTSFHLVDKLSASLPSSSFTASISSYVSEADFLSNKQPIFTSTLEVPFSAIGNNVARSIEQWIVAQPNNIFFQGDVIAAYSTDPLVAAKYRQWVLIKAKRAELIAAIDMDLSTNEINSQIASIKSTATDLKAQIYAATEIEDVLPITWPS